MMEGVQRTTQLWHTLRCDERCSDVAPVSGKYVSGILKVLARMRNPAGGDLSVLLLVVMLLSSG